MRFVLKQTRTSGRHTWTSTTRIPEQHCFVKCITDWGFPKVKNLTYHDPLGGERLEVELELDFIYITEKLSSLGTSRLDLTKTHFFHLKYFRRGSSVLF